MEKKSGTKRGRKGRKEEENPNQSQEQFQECDSSEGNAGQRNMDSSNATDKEKGKSKKGSKGKKGAKRPKLGQSQSVQPRESAAGPSGLCGSSYETEIRIDGSTIICKYKPDKPVPSTSKAPYEVKWGTEFLYTLLPKVEKQKSIMKSPSDEKKIKRRTKFSLTTVYYFERAQPHSTIPVEGDKAVGMEQTHFYTNLVPIEVYEEQKQERFKRELAAMNYEPQDRSAVEAQLSQGDGDQEIILHTIQVPAELLEEEDVRSGCIRNVPAGCRCNDYCDPQLCECNLKGRPCHVIKDGFPCGCKLVYCKNTKGRREYNTRYVRKNLVSFTNFVSNAREAYESDSDSDSE